MDYLTSEQVKDWARDQPDDGYYCESCLTRLAQNDEGKYYCPNEVCLWDDQIEITEEVKSEGH